MKESNKDAHPAHAGIRSIRHGIFANLFLALVKGFVGFFGNSFALIADAIESTADVFTSMIVWIGLKSASKPPDDDHPHRLGHVQLAVHRLRDGRGAVPTHPSSRQTSCSSQTFSIRLTEHLARHHRQNGLRRHTSCARV